MADDFYPFVDSGDPAPDNAHITGEHPASDNANAPEEAVENTVFATRISIYDDLLSTPRILVIQPSDPRTYLEEVTNTVYRAMKEQGGALPLMIIRELVENFIHAHFTEPIVSILDGGNTIRFTDLGPGIADKERAFEFGVTSANRSMKRYIRGTGAGLPMVQQYLENAGGAVSIEDNLGCGTVVTVSIDAARVREIEGHAKRGAAVRASAFTSEDAHIMRGQNIPATPSFPSSPSGAYPAQTYPVGYPYPGMAPVWSPWQGYPAAGSMAPGAATPLAAAAPSPYGAPASTGMPNPYGTPAAMDAPTSYAPQPTTSHATAAPYIDDRAACALAYIADAGQGGPSDLAEAYGSSVPTWSRVLATLDAYGLVEKHGRKRVLTDQGAAWVASHRGDAR